MACVLKPRTCLLLCKHSTPPINVYLSCFDYNVVALNEENQTIKCQRDRMNSCWQPQLLSSDMWAVGQAVGLFMLSLPLAIKKKKEVENACPVGI